VPDQCTRASGKFRYLAADEKVAWLVEVDRPKELDWTNGLDPAKP